MHTLLPDDIPSVDLEEENAKKVIFNITKQYLLQVDFSEGTGTFHKEKEKVLESLRWQKGQCKGLQAGNLMQPIADHFKVSFNLFTADLRTDVVNCEHFACLKAGDVTTKRLNIVCVPSNGQFLGGKNYDLHYIPASYVATSS